MAKDKLDDSTADGIAAVALITIVIVSVILWLTGLPA